MPDFGDYKTTEATPLAIVEPTPLARPETPTESLIRIALDKGQSPTELYAILREERQHQAIAAFNAAFAAFQAECPEIPKDGVVDYVTKSGSRTHYQFAPLDTMAAAIRPILARNGLCYGWDSDVEGGKLKCTCTLRHELGHRETASITLPTESMSPGMGPQQAVASALTFAMRQTLRSVLGLTSTDPDDEAGEPGGMTTITEDQARTLNDLIIEAGADREAFLAWALPTTARDDRKLAAVAANKFDTACAMLNKKIRDKVKGKA